MMMTPMHIPDPRNHNARPRIRFNPYGYQMTHLDDPHDGASLHGLLVSCLPTSGHCSCLLMTECLPPAWWTTTAVLTPTTGPGLTPACFGLGVPSQGTPGPAVVTGDSRLAEDAGAAHHSNTHSTHSE